MRRFCFALVLLFVTGQSFAADRPDIVFADFEGETYGEWKVEGAAFGTGPARGSLRGQMPVEGFLGKGLVNSFNGGDGPTGKLTSPEFTVDRAFITFLIGGGDDEEKLCLKLFISGKSVRSATGPNKQAGGSEMLGPASWDVREFAGKTARIEIIDQASGGWGHINVDHILLTDQKPIETLNDVKRELLVEKRLLHLPVKNGAAKRNVAVLVDGKVERAFDIELADAEPDWWAFLDISGWRGKAITVHVDKLREDSRALTSIEQSDALKSAAELYREPLRPQFHFSARRGWLNDPNGLVYFQGEWHLFFQHNPYGWDWGNMHWGQAVSRDLLSWDERGEALYPDELGTMFSGSAVVDWKNTSGFGTGTEPPIVLMYTAAGGAGPQSRGKGFSQGLAFSNDRGKSWTKFAGNPVLPQITGGNRDPKVLWHEPTRRWVMTLYVERDKKHTIEFFSSPNLKEWTLLGAIEGLFECPDFFELPVDGDAKNKKWVLTGASSEYMLGSFDGKTFLPETPKLPGHRGRGFYAAQTYSDAPDGRRIQIGWLQAPSPGMSFNQCMSLPLELSLKGTDDGPRLAFQPVKENEKLRAKHHATKLKSLKPGDANPLADVKAELLELRAEFAPSPKTLTTFTVRGITVTYDFERQDLIVNGHRTFAPLIDGRHRLAIFVDQTTIEVFANDGLTYIPVPAIPKKTDCGLAISVTGGDVQFQALDVYELRSTWNTRHDK